MKKYYLFDGKKFLGPFDISELKFKKISKDTPIWESSEKYLGLAGQIKKVSNLTKNGHPSVFSGLRSFLESNKIFFEIFLTTIISIMAVYVSWQANKVSIQSNEISSRQLSLSEKDTRPNFEILNTLSNSQDSSDKYSEHLIIYNRGGANWTSPDIMFYTFLTIPHVFNDGEDLYQIEGVVKEPVGITGNSEGEIAEIEINDTRDKINQIEHYCHIIETRRQLTPSIIIAIRIICEIDSSKMDSTYFLYRENITKIQNESGEKYFQKGYSSVAIPLSSLDFNGFKRMLDID